jgi:hypothetical protein
MPYERAIIPRDIEGFNLYITQTNAHLILGVPTNAVLYGWTAQNLSDWQNFQNEWEPLFFSYSDKKGGYTTAIKTKLEGIIANAVIYDRENKLILKVKATVGLTVDDCIIFRIPQSYASPQMIKLQDTSKADKNKAIATLEGVYPRLLPTIGGFVKAECFLEITESGRAHKPEGYDLVEYAVAVFYRGTANLPTAATDTRLTVTHSSKATFVLQTANMTTNLPALAADAVEPSRIAIFFFRWAKSKHPELDGPWSGPFSTPLL